MITILLIVLTLVAVFVTVKLIDKFVPQSKKWIFTILFWIIAIVIGKALYDSIMAPIEFKKTKEVRYTKIIENLRDIRDAEVAHKTVTGQYSGDWNALVKFIDTAQYTLTQRRDSTILDVELTKQFGGVEMFKEIVIIDTIGTASVKDSIFKNSTRYKTMMNVPDTNAKFDLSAGVIEKGKSKLPVFEAKVAKTIILAGEPANLVAEEIETVAVDGVNGADLSVGSMTEVSTNGNWPRKYDDN